VIALRVLIVVVIVLAIALGTRLYRAWRMRIGADTEPVPRLPNALLDGERTWVVFTTPYCATCEPVVKALQSKGDRVVKVDATREPRLADDFRIKAAPTALLADATGEVQTRLVGADAVRDYVRTAASS
jgi:thiol-disulfide isomerase/thioredoxin